MSQREFIKNLCGKHISNEQFNASLMCSHIRLGQGVPQECGKHISDSSAHW